MAQLSTQDIIKQFLSDTDPSKDYTKESTQKMLERQARIKKYYKTFFESLVSSTVPPGGLEGQVLTKNSDISLDLSWKNLPQQQNNIDGGAPDSVYLSFQKHDGGSID